MTGVNSFIAGDKVIQNIGFDHLEEYFSRGPGIVLSTGEFVDYMKCRTVFIELANGQEMAFYEVALQKV